MADAIHTEARFNDEDAAREHLESVYWPNGPVCPHCGGTERNTRLHGTAHRPGLLYCADCKSQFTVTVGTVFERSKVPLHKWVYATHLMCASKKGISAKQLERMLGVTYKTAWFMAHRIREAMTGKASGPLGSGGGMVEADETYWGNVGKQRPGARGGDHKMKIVSLVDRDSGEKRVAQPREANARRRRFECPRSTDEAREGEEREDAVVSAHFRGDPERDQRAEAARDRKQDHRKREQRGDLHGPFRLRDLAFRSRRRTRAYRAAERPHQRDEADDADDADVLVARFAVRNA